MIERKKANDIQWFERKERFNGPEQVALRNSRT